MIMQRQSDGTYSQIGFIRTPTEDIDKIVDRNGDVYFEKGFTRQITGTPPLSLDSIGKPLINYKIYGNTMQDGTPSPENPVEVQSVGDKTRNLFDFLSAFDGCINSISDNGYYYVTFPKRKAILKSEFKEKTAYTLSCYAYGFSPKPENSRCGIFRIFYTDGTIKELAINSTIQKKYICTTDAEKTVDYILITWGAGQVAYVKDVMLEEGSEPTPYVPYGYEIPVVCRSENHEPVTTSIFLDKPLYKDDYIIKDRSGAKLHRAWGVKVFDGTEEIFYDDDNLRFRCVQIKNMKVEESVRKTRIYSSHYIALYNNEPFSLSFNKVIYSNGNNTPANSGFSIHDKSFESVNAFKSFLASEYAKGTPVTVYYPLETPTEESIELPEIPTFDGTTTIEIGTEIQPSDMEITYKSRR